MNCPLCHQACDTCWDSFSTTCFTCAPTFFMAEGNNTCFVKCPAFWFDNTTHMVCTSCSWHCLTCINGTHCTACEAPTFLDLATAECVIQCPITFFGNQTSRTCDPCREGCANCTDYNNCFQCVNTSYFVDQTTTICWKCSEYCLTCYGPTHYNCLTCKYPLFRDKSHTCVSLLCPYGQYVDSVKGCLNCSSLFANSLKCNTSEALLCHRSSMLVGGVCVACASVTGYHLDSTGDCNEICGDGLLIKYQCDDGNRRNGDGCSSNCLIEPGWTCVNSSSGSKCTLQSSLSISVLNIHKYARENVILLKLLISIDLYVDSSNFVMEIAGLGATEYKVEIMSQQPSKLKEVECKVSYWKSVAGKQINLVYTSAGGRRLQETGQFPLDIEEQENVFVASNRMLVSVSFQITVDSFPPANFIEPNTNSFYSNC